MNATTDNEVMRFKNARCLLPRSHALGRLYGECDE